MWHSSLLQAQKGKTTPSQHIEGKTIAAVANVQFQKLVSHFITQGASLHVSVNELQFSVTADTSRLKVHFPAMQVGNSTVGFLSNILTTDTQCAATNNTTDSWQCGCLEGGVSSDL